MSDCRPVQLECTNCRAVTRVADLRPVIRCPHCETPLTVRARAPLTGVATALPATPPRSPIETAPAPRQTCRECNGTGCVRWPSEDGGSPWMKCPECRPAPAPRGWIDGGGI